MSQNFLLLNSDKTEVITFGPKHLRDKLSNHIMTLDGFTLTSSNTVKNLGVILDQDLSFNSRIKQVCRTSFFHLLNISKIRNMLTLSDAEKLIHAFVTSRVDYCNSLLSGCQEQPPSKSATDSKCCSKSFDQNQQDSPHHPYISFSSLASCEI